MDTIAILGSISDGAARYGNGTKGSYGEFCGLGIHRSARHGDIATGRDFVITLAVRSIIFDTSSVQIQFGGIVAEINGLIVIAYDAAAVDAQGTFFSVGSAAPVCRVTGYIAAIEVDLCPGLCFDCAAK